MYDCSTGSTLLELGRFKICLISTSYAADLNRSRVHQAWRLGTQLRLHSVIIADSGPVSPPLAAWIEPQKDSLKLKLSRSRWPAANRGSESSREQLLRR